MAAISGLAVVMTLSGCTGPGPKPHTAMRLAHGITCCTQFFRQPPSYYAMQDVVCPLPDYALVEITTFRQLAMNVNGLATQLHGMKLVITASETLFGYRDYP